MSLTLTGVGLNVPAVAAGGDTIIMSYFDQHPAWSSYDAETGYNFTRTQSANCLGAGLAYQGSAANADDGDEVSWYVNLAAGTYTLTVIHVTDADRGVADLYLDGVQVGSYDGYSASAARNVVSEVTSIAVAADGNYLFKMKVDGKHASSTDYVMTPQWWSLIRTGA